MSIDITLTGMNPEFPAVRRLMAISMYASGVPVKIIEADTGIREHTLARLMRTYGVPQRRQTVSTLPKGSDGLRIKAIAASMPT